MAHHDIIITCVLHVGHTRLHSRMRVVTFDPANFRVACAAKDHAMVMTLVGGEAGDEAM